MGEEELSTFEVPVQVDNAAEDQELLKWLLNDYLKKEVKR